MDDRTTIALELFLESVRFHQQRSDEGISLEKIQTMRTRSVEQADHLLAELARTAPAQPTPQPKASGLLFRSMDEHPSDARSVLAVNTHVKNWAAVVLWWDAGNATWRLCGGGAFVPSSNHRWCEIPRPEVSE